MRILNTSDEGYTFENILCSQLIAKLGGRAATKYEQIHEQIDYILDNVKMDVKHQPKAYSYKTINIEIEEYETNNPSNRHNSYWLTSTAEIYIWHVGDSKAYWFLKSELAPYVDALINNPMHIKAKQVTNAGGKISRSNGQAAKAMSAKHGSKKLDNAVTIRMPISIIKSLPSTAEIYVDKYGYITGMN